MDATLIICFVTIVLLGLTRSRILVRCNLEAVAFIAACILADRIPVHLLRAASTNLNDIAVVQATFVANLLGYDELFANRSIIRNGVVVIDLVRQIGNQYRYRNLSRIVLQSQHQGNEAVATFCGQLVTLKLLGQVNCREVCLGNRESVTFVALCVLAD